MGEYTRDGESELLWVGAGYDGTKGCAFYVFTNTDEGRGGVKSASLGVFLVQSGRF